MGFKFAKLYMPKISFGLFAKINFEIKYLIRRNFGEDLIWRYSIFIKFGDCESDIRNFSRNKKEFNTN